jgi:hypothetical protein
MEDEAMFRGMAMGMAVGLLSISVRGAEPAAQQSQQYLIHVTRTKRAACEGQTENVLAAPTVATVENREAYFHVGGEKTVAGETIDFGTKLKVRVRAAGDNKVTLRGTLETAAVSEAGDDFATRTSTASYFQRTIALDEAATFKLP